jgi:hypothetical protein
MMSSAFKLIKMAAYATLISGAFELSMAQLMHTNLPKNSYEVTPNSFLAFQAGKIASPSVVPMSGLKPEYELTMTQKASIEANVRNTYPYTVVQSGTCTRYYNCHNFAWHFVMGQAWMNDPSLNWKDGSYSSIHSDALPGWLPQSFYKNYISGAYMNGVDRIKMVWATMSPEHSASVDEFVEWDSGSSSKITAFVTSKWGAGPICRHYSHYGFHPYWNVSTIQTTYRRAVYP